MEKMVVKAIFILPASWRGRPSNKSVGDLLIGEGEGSSIAA